MRRELHYSTLYARSRHKHFQSSESQKERALNYQASDVVNEIYNAGKTAYDNGSWKQILLQTSIFVLHMVGAIVVLSYWLRIANNNSSTAFTRLVQNAYGTMDMKSGVESVINKGFDTSFITESPMRVSPWFGLRRLPVLNSKTILSHMQPVTIFYKTNVQSTLNALIASFGNLLTNLGTSMDASGYTWMPSMCNFIPITDTNTSSTITTKMDVAAWRVCKFADVPMTLVDVPFTHTSIIPFASNNFLFLLYVTLFLTGILALAFTRPAEKQNLAVAAALIFLFANLVFVMFAASADLGVPVNNAMIGVLLHFVVGVAVVLVSRNRNGIRLVDEKDAKLLDTEPDKESLLQPLLSLEQVIATVESVSILAEKEKQFRLFDAKFIPQMQLDMSWIELKYFEYALTAGLFLVGVLLLFKPHADVYIYQIAYIGMFACNIVAIPLHKVFLHVVGMPKYWNSMQMDFSKEQQFLMRTHGSFAMGAFLIASCLFFAAGFVPYTDVLIQTTGLSKMPAEILAAAFITALFFLAFAIAGTIIIVVLLAKLMTQENPHVKPWINGQNWTFEALNTLKWMLALFICVGGLQSIGFV